MITNEHIEQFIAQAHRYGMAGKSKKKPALGEEKGIFRQRKRHIWVLYLSFKKKKELNFHAF